MNTDPSAAGLSLDQAPPLAIPLRFFFTAPLFIATSGVLALGYGEALLVSRHMPVTLAFVHCGTLGALSMVVLGALYQMTPVVAASPVPRVGLARLVHALFCAGLVAFLAGVLAHAPRALELGSTAIAGAWLLFALPVGLALARSPARSEPTVRGMQLSVLTMLFVLALGATLAFARAGAWPLPARDALASLHLGLALLGFIGGLIVAVSFQVMPMFYLSPTLPARGQLALLVALASSVLLSAAAATVALIVPHALIAPLHAAVPLVLLPAALAAWVVHPLLTLRALRLRKRVRPDPSLRFFFASFAAAPACALLALGSFVVDDARIGLGLGFLAVFGWALGILHGMLYRIVPFLVWFHRLSRWVGIRPVPSALRLLPQDSARAAFAAHIAFVLVGCFAIALRSGALVRIAGVLACALALLLARTLLVVARYQGPAEP